ncbi:hypothetical protein [Pararhizobium haloflavum]|uniref:hypothetical protein n=1 Tax=Pararhizobium haloflavum TaxID=2037914 RepID=UPI000C17E9B9|nr:hypothetical protein [Pararhizobium haloflavum]
MDKKTGSFKVVDDKGKQHRVDEYHDVMASGALGMRHHVLEDGRKVTNLGDGRFAIDVTQEVLVLADEPEPA